MSLVTIAEIRGLIETDLVDSALQSIIDESESFLQRRIGLLTGARTQTVYVYAEDRPIRLQRPTDAISVVDGSGTSLPASGVRLRGRGYIVERVVAGVIGSPATIWWMGPVAITSTPNDLPEVKGGIRDLVRLTLASSAYTAESNGAYSYSRQSSREDEAAREAIADRFLPERLPKSVEVGTRFDRRPMDRIEAVFP